MFITPQVLTAIARRLELLEDPHERAIHGSIGPKMRRVKTIIDEADKNEITDGLAVLLGRTGGWHMTQPGNGAKVDLDEEDAVGINFDFKGRLGAKLIATIIWLVLSSLYVWATATKSELLSVDNFAKVSVPIGAACIAFYVAWHNTKTSALERSRTAKRHAETLKTTEARHLQVMEVAESRHAELTRTADAKHAELVKASDAKHQEILQFQRVRLAYDMLRTLDEQNRVDLRFEVRRQFSPIQTNAPAIKAKMEENPELELKVAKVLGSFEDLAIAARCGHADEAILFASFGGLVVKFYLMFRLHIEERRKDQGNRGQTSPAYCELEALAKSWEKGRSVRTNDAIS